ncbi:hypothetical protein LRS74_32275 [Streptomyces sp. LX-29]|uniref:hypothetical protein n=1 Tax=Streptomyces sp. LX-29 TaxID=2900152 RepID=UPI00240E8FCC|nr:hypothetical protein [Streptomyces sp. LX-29]WFB11191.1 hypothetical protein LRS74_32275 [Streptomyces sp. LX-29]
MSDRTRRTPPRLVSLALAGVWALVLLLTGATPGTAAGAASAPTSPLSPTSPASPLSPVLRVADPAPPHDRSSHARPSHARSSSSEHPRASAVDAHLTAQHQRPTGPPATLPGPVARAVPFPLVRGEVVGPRRERAPPAAPFSPRRPRGPPFTRSS